MTKIHVSDSEVPFARPPQMPRWKRLALALGLSATGALILFLILWSVFFRYVPPGSMLVIIAKNGDDLPPGQVVAEEGQRGIQRKVLGEGWHYVTPIVYTTEVHKNTVIHPGHAGVVTALGGVPPADGRVLAEDDKEQGIQRHVLMPGSYRLNPYAFKVEEVPAVRINPGFIGVERRLLGKDGADRFARGEDEKGILREVLQPGVYYINTKEFEVIPCEVGIYQTSYHYVADSPKSTAISFPAKDGNTISMDCTIEWEVRPKDWPELVAEYGGLTAVERNVVDQHARKISRDRGFNFGAQDFLEGEKREKFQNDFTHELERACKENKVLVRSAFIRTIVIPENFLEQKRKRQLAVETRLTTEAKGETAQSEAEVEEAKRMIDQREAEVKAETARLVAGIDRDAENVKYLTEAEIEQLKADYGAKIADLDAKRQRVLGEAEAQAKKMRETARSEIFKMKMDVFGNDGSAYLRYTMAQQLNPKMVLRLFHSGPGTLWTNLGDKNVNLLLPATGADTSTAPRPTVPDQPMPPAK